MKLKPILWGLAAALIAAPLLAAYFFSPWLTASSPAPVSAPSLSPLMTEPTSSVPATTAATPQSTSDVVASQTTTAAVPVVTTASSSPVSVPNGNSRPIIRNDPDWSRSVANIEYYREWWPDSEGRRWTTTQITWDATEQGAPPRLLMREQLADGGHRWFYAVPKFRTVVSFALLTEADVWEEFHVPPHAEGTAAVDTIGHFPYMAVAVVKEHLVYPPGVDLIPYEQYLDLPEEAFCDWGVGFELPLEEMTEEQRNWRMPPLPDWWGDRECYRSF